MDPLFTFTAQFFLAAVLLLGAIHKFSDPGAFEEAVGVIFPVPASLRKVLVHLVPVMELIIAIALVAPFTTFFGAWAALMLISIYTLALSIAFMRGKRDFDCGCSWGRAAPVARPSLLVRNALLLLAGAIAVFPPLDRPLSWFDSGNLLLGSAAFLIFYIALEALLALPAQPSWRQHS